VVVEGELDDERREDDRREDDDHHFDGLAVPLHGGVGTYRAIACARRLTSAPRFSRSASIGRPGRSASVKSQAMISRSSYRPSWSSVSRPPRPLTGTPSSPMNAAGTRGAAPGADTAAASSCSR